MKFAFSIAFTFALIIQLLSPPAQAFARSRQDLMISVGNSVSAAFIASSSAVAEGALDDASESSKFLGASAPGVRHDIPGWQLFLAQLLNHKHSYSWASGIRINSHYLRLQKALAEVDPSVKLVVKNVSKSGAVTGDLYLQANRILQIWNTGSYENIRYLTFEIGTNDACASWVSGGVPEAEMAKNIWAFFDRISVIHQSEPIRVLISSIPNVPDLGVPEVIHHVLPSGRTCEYKMFQVDHYCNSLVKWSTSAEYEQNVAVIDRKNALLKSLSAEIQQKYPQFQIVFSESFNHQAIRIDRLAKDCFHPNVAGQADLAEALWADQAWWK